MKAFSKAISVLLLAALMLGLCACAGGEGALTSAAGAAPEDLLPVRISELMPSNKACLALDDGSFPDWVELENTGTQPVSLDGCSLVCKGKRMVLEKLSVEPGGFVLIPLEGVKLPKEGETVSLLSASGAEIDKVSFEPADADQSLVRDGDGLVATRWPSPGYTNSAEGYEARQQELTGAELVISEVMVYNARILPQADGSTPDWVELKNVSDRAVELGGYALSDKGSERQRGKLPAQTLAPGECVVLLCGAEGVTELPNLPFSLAADCEQLFLSRADGSLCDFVSLHDIPLGMSCGRMDGEGGFFYFAEPSPGADNTDGCRRISDKPTADGPDGVFEKVDGVTVALSGPGEIYYSTDGTVPTAEATRYTGPIRFTQTGVLRAVCIEDGCLPSEPLDLSYILNEGHTIPVVSVLCNPDDLFSMWDGIYSNPSEDWERPASAALFADERGFEAIACGIKIHGATSRLNMQKKSFKLNFRSRYGGELECDLFENGITTFSSVLLRASQESSISTEMRDVVMHELAMQCDPSLSTQAHRYCVLYLNGEYWGVYALREAHSAEHFARHNGYDPEQVEMWKGAWPSDSPTQKLYDSMVAGNMKDDAFYASVCEHLDLESIIAWGIIQSYSSNTDTASPNMRFYYSAEDDKLHYALVDLDLGFFSYREADLPLKTGYRYSDLIALLMENEGFCKLYLQRMSEYLNGPLSDENFLAMVDKLSSEIRDEMPRDYQRWQHNPVFWQKEIDTYLVGATQNLAGGRAWLLARSAQRFFKLSEAEWDALFGDIPQRTELKDKTMPQK